MIYFLEGVPLRRVVIWFLLALTYWRFFRPRRIMPEHDLTWVEYAAAAIPPLGMEIVAVFGL